jgi:hypothetical protein
MKDVDYSSHFEFPGHNRIFKDKQARPSDWRNRSGKHRGREKGITNWVPLPAGSSLPACFAIIRTIWWCITWANPAVNARWTQRMGTAVQGRGGYPRSMLNKWRRSRSCTIARGAHNPPFNGHQRVWLQGAARSRVRRGTQSPVQKGALTC